MTWNLILKFLSLLILVVEELYLMNPTDATLASLSVLKYSRWRPRWPSVRLLRSILQTKSNFTQLIYIPFLGIGNWYLKCVCSYLCSIIHVTFEFHNFAVINATTTPNERGLGGKINFYKRHHF